MSPAWQGSTPSFCTPRAGLSEPVAEQYGELVHGRFPVVRRPSPVLGNVAQCQPDQFGGRIVTGEVPTRFDDLAQPRVHALDGVGRVDHAPHFGWEGKERYHPVPGPAPGSYNGRELLTPWPHLKCVEFSLGGLCAHRRVDRFNGRSQRPAVLPAGKVQAVANQMHDAGLKRRGREHRTQRLWHAFEPVRHSNQDVLHATGLQIVEDLHPELRPFGVLHPYPQDVATAIGQHAQGQVHGLGAHHYILANLDAQRIKKYHRVHRLQWATLPGRDLAHHFVGDID